ncbi:MAG: hypothetical protein MRY83_09470, partial [Flavobacteriales bacterium]|nr:hypothetical protein [Flavobacteriales bacterium]
ALKIAQKVVSSFRALDFWEGSFSYQFFPLEKMENVQELLKRENIEWSNFLIESRNLKEDMIVNLSDRLEVLQENF